MSFPLPPCPFAPAVARPRPSHIQLPTFHIPSPLAPGRSPASPPENAEQQARLRSLRVPRTGLGIGGIEEPWARAVEVALGEELFRDVCVRERELMAEPVSYLT